MSVRRLFDALRSRFGGRAEPGGAPDEGLRRLVCELDGAFYEIEQSVGKALVEERRLRADLEEVRARAEEWQDRAVRALERGDDERARDALVKKKECEATAARIEASWERQRRAADELKGSLRAVRDRADEARRRYGALLSRYEAAAAARRLQRSLEAARSAPFDGAVRLDEEIRRLEAEIEAQLEVAASSSE
jgi:phage shock protein A